MSSLTSANIIAAIRTIVAAAVGAVIAFFATKGIDIEGPISIVLDGTLFLLITGLYNVAVNWLQARFGKRWGFLLGIPKLPAYDTPD